MASPFDAAMKAADAVVEATFGGAVEIRPMLVSQYKGTIPDPGRAPVTVRGVFTLTPALDRLQGARVGAEMQSFVQISTGDAEIWFRTEEVAKIPYDLKTGDHIALTERAGVPIYSIVRPLPSDLGDLKLVLAVEDTP